MKFILGTQSQRKKKSVEKVLKQLLPDQNVEVINFAAESGVSETPWEQETFDGARNRAKACINEDADYYIGLESGLVKRYGHVYEEAWACILNKDHKEYFGYSSGLKVPDYITKKMESLKLKHWEVMKFLEEEHNLPGDDTWGNYSSQMIVRDLSLEEALRNALVQIFAPKESFYHK